MTLEEAIKEYRHTANSFKNIDECKDVFEFNSQIADWLEELLITRKALVIACNNNEYIADIYFKMAKKEVLNGR